MLTLSDMYNTNPFTIAFKMRDTIDISDLLSTFLSWPLSLDASLLLVEDPTGR